LRAKRHQVSETSAGFGGLFLAAALAVCLGLIAVDVIAQDLRFFRIGTGSISGAQFAVGSAIAGAISNPPGSRPCDRGGSCGVPDLLAVAQSTEGSVENVRALAAGQLESALVQADVAYWTYHGTGPFREQGPTRNLRAVANLFPALVHIVVRTSSTIRRVSDLAGKRVSLGPEGSGTPVNALAILAAYGIGDTDITPLYLRPDEASDLLVDGEIDAFFVVGGVPLDAVDDLAGYLPVRLLAIDGAERDEITSFYPFLANGDILAGSYHNVAYTPSVAVGMQFLVSAEASEELTYEVCRALWHERNRVVLDESHPLARQIRLEEALENIAIPLHEGAARCYAELVPTTDTIDHEE
jgi:TRAP transporter TAXI family solute receptor